VGTRSPILVSIESFIFSGSTLLSYLLGSHPRIATVGEMNGLIPGVDPNEYLCSCGPKIKECEFWQAVAAAMRNRGFEFDVAHFDTKFVLGGPRLIQCLRVGSFRNSTLDAVRDVIFLTWPGEIRQLNQLIARNKAFIEVVLELTGKDVFVDTSKDRLRVKYLHRLSTFDVRAIHLVRDVRGAIASRLRRGEEVSVRKAAWQWVSLNKKIQRLLKTLPEEKRIMIRYEDLCLDTQDTLERLYRFCEVDPGVVVTDFRSAAHHVVGNEMRLSNVSEIKLDERWKRMLTEEQLGEIDRVAGALSRQYGY
jgi:hypothetical protein